MTGVRLTAARYDQLITVSYHGNYGSATARVRLRTTHTS
jgi:hypothetical protein